MDEKGNEERKVRICVLCGFHKMDGPAAPIPDCCSSPEAPPTDFVYGGKDARIINEDGRCKFYQERQGT